MIKNLVHTFEQCKFYYLNDTLKKTIEFKINFLYSQLYGEKYFPIVNYTHITVRAKEV